MIVLLIIAGMNLVNAQGFGEWTWVKGNNTPHGSGNFGVKGISSPNNNPPALYEAYEWTDLNGNFWVFGGVGGTDSTVNKQNALWKYNPLTNEWVWMHGSSSPNQFGIYGVQGVPSPNSTPGAKGFGGLSWVDRAGDLWLYGGSGYDANGVDLYTDDLWRYHIATNEWTWMKGSDNAFTTPDPIVGIKGVADVANTPGIRHETNGGLTDAMGNLWLFGGLSSGAYNDVWKYSTSNNMWTWIAGNQTQTNTPNYGVVRVSSPTNDPGDRFCYTKFIDAQNNLYFLGSGLTRINGDVVCDIWKFNTTTTEWTWMGGTSSVNQSGVYGDLCDTSLLDFPTSKYEIRACWPDSCGFFFFGGFTDDVADFDQSYNDLWYYDVDYNRFTWVSGTNIPNHPGNYGRIGISAATNLPPARGGALAFKDKQARLWLFGGGTNKNRYNDLWYFKLDPNCGKLCSKSIFKQPLPVLPEETYDLYIPNVFTPNGDASNNIFAVKAVNYSSYHITIYNRWGLKQFESSDANIHWNGKHQNTGAECPDGTYFYLIQLTDKQGHLSSHKGFLTLLR